MSGDRLEALYVLALNTGMRQGELLALKWDDVDLERGLLRVRRTLTHADKAFVLGEPKTKNSRRTIMLTTSAVAALRVHLSRQLEEIERMGSLYQPGGLIFATEAGTIINPSNLRNRSLKPLLKRAGLRAIRFHDLRHTCATLLLSKNINSKVVSEMLGHSSISITLDIYSHLLPDMQEKAAQTLVEALRWRFVFSLFAGTFRVGDSGFEPLTSSASRKRSPPELIALIWRDPRPVPRGGTRNRTGVQGFADPCLTTRPCRQSRRLPRRSHGPAARADDGSRTRDPHHGKVMLYQLSYVRVTLACRDNLARGSRPYKRPPKRRFREKTRYLMTKKLNVEATTTEMIFATFPTRYVGTSV